MSRMTSGQWIAGCMVVLAATAGGWLSAPWAERTFGRPANLDRAGSANATRSRTCTTVDGKRFEWNFPNPPFGTLNCSD